MDIQARELNKSAQARLEQLHGSEVMNEKWDNASKRLTAIDKIVMHALHDQCCTE